MEMFPEAFFIHIIRDYRAKIVSNRKWFARKKVSLLAYQWVIGNKEIDIQKAKYPRKFYTIRYEDLVVDSERYAKEIAAFLNVNYFPEMLNFHEKTSQEYAKSVSENDNQFQVNLLNTLHNNLLKPINTEKVDSWKSELTEKDVRLADYIAHEYALSYKYYPLYTSSSVILWIVKKWATVKVNLERLAIKLYHLTPDWIRFTTKSISMLLYKVFGFTHIYNPEFREEIKKKMAKK
jgi:hypothetical protein